MSYTVRVKEIGTRLYYVVAWNLVPVYIPIQTDTHVAEISTCESDLLLESGTM